MNLVSPFRSARLRTFKTRSLYTATSSNTTTVSPLERLLVGGARLTHAAHDVWSQVVRPGDLVVDATCGNGHDTLFLAQAVGPSGTVYAFDIQKEAIAATLKRLNENVPADNRPKVVALHTCHSLMEQHLRGQQEARLVAFNLGYLPSSSKVVQTHPETSVAAIQAAFKVLGVGGLLSILAYTGHEGGLQEYEAIKKLLQEQPPAQWVTTELQLLNRPTAPILLLAWRQE